MIIEGKFRRKQCEIADHSLIHERMHSKTVHEDRHNKNFHSDMYFGHMSNNKKRKGGENGRKKENI